jgi:dolichol-phosphate mannosyltransferase
MPLSVKTSSWLAPSLLRHAVCPACRGALRRDDESLQCQSCGHRYRIEHGIPVLFSEAAPTTTQPSTCDLTVLIMAYNEAGNLEHVLPLVRGVLADLECSYEIVIIDGHSSDNTVEVAQRHGARVKLQVEKGYGAAFREGLAACEGEYILTLDSDMSHDPGFIRTLWLAREQGDLLVGSRYCAGAETEMTLFRLYLSLFMNGVFRRVLSMPILDLSSGYRLYRRSMLTNLRLVNRDFDILVEILVQLFARGYQVREIPMYFKPRLEGASNLRVARFGVSYARSLLRLWPVRNSLDSADYDFRAFHSRIPLQRYWQQTRVRIIRDMLEGQTESILDVGCGSSKLLQSLPSAIGLDMRLDKLRFMQRTNRLLMAGDLARLPFADASFDTVICSQVIEHVQHDNVLAELKRVLKAGGRLILGTPDYATWQWRLIEPIYHRVLPRAYADKHVTQYTRGQLKRMLDDAGFDLQREAYVCGAEWIGLACKRK